MYRENYAHLYTKRIINNYSWFSRDRFYKSPFMYSKSFVSGIVRAGEIDTHSSIVSQFPLQRI